MPAKLKQTKKPTKRWNQRIVCRLKRVANDMLMLGADMDYYGGFGEIGEHGREMIGASKVADTWVKEMEKEHPWAAEFRNVLDDAKRARKKRKSK